MKKALFKRIPSLAKKEYSASDKSKEAIKWRLEFRKKFFKHFSKQPRFELLEKHFDELGNLAQILILARLAQKFTMPISIAETTAMFSYSRISVIRAFDELEYFQLGRRNPQNKYMEFPLTDNDLWKQALPY